MGRVDDAVDYWLFIRNSETNVNHANVDQTHDLVESADKANYSFRRSILDQ